jgi:glycosyltransferase involved in cell wall biosynthesis
MRVALISYDFGEYCVQLASAISRMAEVLLLLPQPVAAPYLEALDPGVRLRLFEHPRLRHPRRQLHLALDLVRRIKAFNPDVVHLQHGHAWFNGMLPLLRRYPLVLTAHDARHHPGDTLSRKTPQAVIDFGFRRASRLIVHARTLKDLLVSRCHVAPDIVEVVPHISLERAPDEAPPAAEGPTILFFGRLWPYKGLEYLIRAEPLITAAVPDARIVIAGHGEDFTRYRALMCHPDRFIVYNERVPDARRAELFRQASVVALPYVEASQSGVIPLAYAWRKPIVATEVGGLPEMVEDGRTGYLVPPRDERALASALVRLLRDPRRCREFGLNGHRKLEAECAPAVVARHTLDVYQHALSRV